MKIKEVFVEAFRFSAEALAELLGLATPVIILTVGIFSVIIFIRAVLNRKRSRK